MWGLIGCCWNMHSVECWVPFWYRTWGLSEKILTHYCRRLHGYDLYAAICQQGHSCLALGVAELQSKAWRTVFMLEWQKTSCSCLLTLWLIQAWTHWQLNSMMDSSITPMEYCSSAAIYTKWWLICSVSRSLLVYSVICVYSTVLCRVSPCAIWVTYWPVMLSPRGQSGLEAKILASASKLWPR